MNHVIMGHIMLRYQQHMRSSYLLDARKMCNNIVLFNEKMRILIFFSPLVLVLLLSIIQFICSVLLK